MFEDGCGYCVSALPLELMRQCSRRRYSGVSESDGPFPSARFSSLDWDVLL